MRIFLYEHITATFKPTHPLYAEGAAMRDALRADLNAIDGVSVLAGDFDTSAAQADWTILIAPETEGILQTLAERVLRLGGRLLGPSPEAIRLASDKLALCERWQSAGVRTPETSTANAIPKDYPILVKPRDGAGSEHMAVIHDSAGYEAILRQRPEGMIVQPFIPGTPASIAFLVGPNQILSLQPTRQILGERFHYLGGEVPLPTDLRERALRMGRAAMDSAGPGWLGYVGIDLVLGDEGDFAIEINPRLTTSFVGLRSAIRANLAEAMIRVAEGKPVSDLVWKPGKVRWNAR